jgi:uncharacterized membrane protein YccC
LLKLIRQQAGIADVFQSARDLLYSQVDHPQAQRPIETLIHTVNLRDVVLACQLDLDRLPLHDASPAVIAALAAQLQEQGLRLRAMALALRQGRPWVSARKIHPSPATEPATPNLGDPILNSLGRRSRHMNALMDQIGQTLADAPHTPRLETDGNSRQAQVLLTLVSPTRWTLTPLRAQLHMQSPVLRYALRATLAVACADALAHVLPWSSHPYWILMTVAVVMRGNLEQTLARRDARIQGTLIGCVLASTLLFITGGSLTWLLLALTVALSLAHGYVMINYRITSAAGAVLALVQGHLFTPHPHPALFDALERLGDTLIGAALAWGFSYVLPSWERQQLPRLVARLQQALGHYAHHVLRWHEDHEHSTRRSHARREVYDVLWLLTQSLQRMSKEPEHARQWAPPLETVLIHSHRLISLLAGVKGLLTMQHPSLLTTSTQVALRQAEDQIKAVLRNEAASPDSLSPSHNAADQSDNSDLDAPPPNQDPHALHQWLHQRLTQTLQETTRLTAAARVLRGQAGLTR